MTLEQALISAVGVLAGVIAFLWRHYQAREERIHEQYRAERDGILAELRRTRSEFTRTLMALAGLNPGGGGEEPP